MNAPERTDWTAIVVTWFAVAAFGAWGVGFVISLI